MSGEVGAVLISEDEYDSLRETLYPVRSPAGATRVAQVPPNAGIPLELA